MRPAFFDGIAEAVQRADTGVPAPGELQLDGATRADHLVIDYVRSHSDQGQIAALLADDFMARCVRDQVSETFECDGIAILHEFGDGFAQRKYLSQIGFAPERSL